MGLNDTPSGERLHIGFFGLRNAGKSSLVNAVTGQQLAVVSEIKGTTTDPVKKAMELLPLGPVVIIDTPGLDDEGELGEKRMQKARQILAQTDIAVLVVDAQRGMCPDDESLLELLRARALPFVVAYNKADLISEREKPGENEIYVSAATGENVDALKNMLGAFADRKSDPSQLISDLISPGDLATFILLRQLPS
ncbi:MAG: 50S ribosome-binding GTPase [Oscillospiraceae bacterium]|nr:50S ribosome-binding GTPase [Oscillospiraceae bacterium]